MTMRQRKRRKMAMMQPVSFSLLTKLRDWNNDKAIQVITHYYEPDALDAAIDRSMNDKGPKNG